MIESIVTVTYKVGKEIPRASDEVRMKIVAEQPDNLVLELLRGLGTEIGALTADVQSMKVELRAACEEMATKGDLNSLRADVASDLLNMQKETREQIVGVRRVAIEYYSSVVGHGI